MTSTPPTPGHRYHQAARDFFRRAQAIHTLDNIAQELVTTLRETLGATRGHLIVVDSSGDVHLVGEAVPGFTKAAGESALDRITVHPGPIVRSQLTPEDKPLSAVLDPLGSEVAIPLRYRGAVIGMITVGTPSPPQGEQTEFLRRLGHEASIVVANSHLHGDRHDKAGTGKQVSLANALQDALLPEERPIRRGNLVLRGLFRPALECGGDFWTWEELGRGRLLVAIGDVTGKGVPAAMLVATAKGVACAMRVSRSGELNPSHFLRTLNASIFRAAQTQWLMTCFAVVIDIERGSMTYANAGHNFPYVRTAKGELQQLVLRGNTLGAAAECDYASDERVLAPGDLLLLYTDGVIDATHPMTGETYGEKRLRKLIQQGTKGTPPSAETLPSLLLAETEKHKTPAGRMIDDITIVAVANEKATS